MVQSSVCSDCSNPYSSCPVCESDFCQSCTSFTGLLHSYEQDPGSVQSVCEVCFHNINAIETIIQNEGIVWATLTVRGQQWMSSSGAVDFMMRFGDSINTYLDLNVKVEDLEMINKDVYSGRSDPSTFSWELHELLARVIPDSFRENIGRVLRAFCAKNSGIGYCQGLNYVVTWLLLFMDENAAFWMLCNLIEEWLLPDFYIGNKHGNSLNGFYIESTVIASLLEFIIPDISQSGFSAHEFCDMFTLQILIQLFINVADIESTIFLWDKLASDGSIALIRGTVSLIHINQDIVKGGMHPFKLLKAMLNYRIRDQLEITYTNLQESITEARVTRLRGQARDYRASQWKTQQTLIMHRLAKASNFTKEEIQFLQDQFNNLLEMKRTKKGRSLQMNPAVRRKTVFLPDYMQKEIEHTEGNVDIGITADEYQQIIESFNPMLTQFAHKLFEYFDEDKSGYLDFRELVVSLSTICKGTFDEKVKVCFDLHDSAKKGYLDKEEYISFIDAVLLPSNRKLREEYSQDLQDHVDMLFDKYLEIMQEGKITSNDILTGIDSNPELRKNFQQVFGEDSNSTQKFFASFQTDPSGVRLRSQRNCIGCVQF